MYVKNRDVHTLTEHAKRQTFAAEVDLWENDGPANHEGVHHTHFPNIESGWDSKTVYFSSSTIVDRLFLFFFCNILQKSAEQTKTLTFGNWFSHFF